MENGPFIDGLPIIEVIFYSYVKLPEGTRDHNPTEASLLYNQKTDRIFCKSSHHKNTDFIKHRWLIPLYPHQTHSVDG